MPIRSRQVTACPWWTSSAASTLRCNRPPRSTVSPATVTTSGPNSWNCIGCRSREVSTDLAQCYRVTEFSGAQVVVKRAFDAMAGDGTTPISPRGAPPVSDPYTSPRSGSAALILIDVQKDFYEDAAPARVEGTLEAVPAMVELTAAFRAQGRPIVHVIRLYRT